MKSKTEQLLRRIANAGLLLVAVCATSSAIAADPDSPTGSEAGAKIATYCTSCHGQHGVSKGPATPTIARLTRNYLVGAMFAYKYADDLDKADQLIELDEEIWDAVVFARPPGAMNAIAAMLSDEEIKAVSTYFSEQNFSAPVQQVDEIAAAAGANVHERYCAKCHEDGGANTADDVGLLAGQWKLYLTYLMEDLSVGDRDAPRKMADKVKGLHNDLGDAGIGQLIEYYASQAGSTGGS